MTEHTLIAAAATAAGAAPDTTADSYDDWLDRVATIAADLGALGDRVAKKVATAVVFPEDTTDHKTFEWNDVLIDRVEEAGNSKRLRIFYEVPEHLVGKFTDDDGTENVVTLRSFEEGGEAQQELARSLVGKRASFTKLSFKEDGEKRNLVANLRPAGDTPVESDAPSDTARDDGPSDEEKAKQRQQKADEANAAQAAEEAAEAVTGEVSLTDIAALAAELGLSDEEKRDIAESVGFDRTVAESRRKVYDLMLARKDDGETVPEPDNAQF